MTGLDGLASIAIAFLIVTVSPGPAIVAVATVSLRAGRRPGLSFGLGLSAGLAVWGVVAATGLGAVLQSSAVALSVLKLGGGVYLLWLAYQSARAAIAKPLEATMEADTLDGRWFRRGLLLNLSNPKAVVAWMAAFSMGLGAGDTASFVMLATVLCMAIGLASYTLYALAFSLPGFRQGYARLSRWIDGAVAGLFAFAGLGLVRSAFARS